MKNRMLNKLRSKLGESIGETLIALLISSLALMMLAGAVSSAMRVVTNSRTAMENYYAVNNALVERDRTILPDDVKGEGTFTGTFAINVNNLIPDATSVSATYYKNEQLATPVIAYTYKATE